MERTWLAAIAVCLAAPVAAQDDRALRLAPSSVWAVNYADESCELGRRFGTGDDEVTLVLRANGPGGLFVVSAFGKPLNLALRSATIFVRLGDVEQLPITFFALATAEGIPGIQSVQQVSVGPVPNPRDTVPRVGLPGVLAVDPAYEKRMDYLALESVLAKDVVLETGSMGEPLAALRTCVDELMTHWNVNLETQRTLSRRPIPKTNPQTWIRSGDYPGGARRNALVNFRLVVDEQGGVAECVIQGATQPKEFAATACSRLNRRAEFEPALDAAGRPTRSYYLSSVVFVYPG